MAKNFPNLGLENRQQYPGSQWVPNRMNPKGTHIKTCYNLNAKVKDKERMLKAEREV